MSDFAVILELGLKVKAALKEKKKRKGHTKCPICGQRVNAILAGPKDHLHMACVTPNCIRLME